jgi:hypothetical protein
MANHLEIANPGSALGEAIGSSMEAALKELLSDIADEHGCYYITSGVRKTKSGTKMKKLLMADNFGTEYDIDGVIANESMQPLIIIESKYIRYKKHNRDKGSWICTAHPAIRRRYHSIRSSIAVLAGSWSRSSLAMMKSHEINLFVVPFEDIVKILMYYKIVYNWGEKDKDVAYEAWNSYNELGDEQKLKIGKSMITSIKGRLIGLINEILSDETPREIDKVTIELVSNLGEVKYYEFSTSEEAINFLQEEELDALFLTSESDTLFDPPPELD